MNRASLSTATTTRLCCAAATTSRAPVHSPLKISCRCYAMTFSGWWCAACFCDFSCSKNRYRYLKISNCWPYTSIPASQTRSFSRCLRCRIAATPTNRARWSYRKTSTNTCLIFYFAIRNSSTANAYVYAAMAWIRICLNSRRWSICPIQTRSIIYESRRGAEYATMFFRSRACSSSNSPTYFAHALKTK